MSASYVSFSYQCQPHISEFVCQCQSHLSGSASNINDECQENTSVLLHGYQCQCHIEARQVSARRLSVAHYAANISQKVAVQFMCQPITCEQECLTATRSWWSLTLPSGQTTTGCSCWRPGRRRTAAFCRPGSTCTSCWPNPSSWACCLATLPGTWRVCPRRKWRRWVRSCCSLNATAIHP